MKSPSSTCYSTRSTPSLSLSTICVLGVLVLGMLHAALGSSTLALLLAAGSTLLATSTFIQKKSRCQWLLLFLGASAIGWGVFNILSLPANAQFLQGAESFFSSTFTDSASAITTVFGSLRALYLIYLFVSFIGVFNAVRQDEDWLAAARTPAIVVISVTLVDVLTALITGGGTTAI
ncbi:hypothetical protein IQ272_19560 [Chroococcidiopsidales cyanobacterium LEGE 13417]|nr:hypothetical protein [Chroococcidiopsidales cyanobacterium LEGE 13417]